MSTNGQATDGYGLDVQEADLRKWAKVNKHKLIKVVADEGVSGKTELDGRAGLAEAMAMLGNGEADGIVVPRLDRLARDLIIQETIIAEVRKTGKAIFSAMDGENLFLTDEASDPSRKMIRQILGAVAEYDRAMTILRLQSGRASKASKGGYAGYGSPAYGQRSEDKELTADDREQLAIARMIELDDEGASLRKIVDALHAEGHRPKRGDRWHPTTVSRCLTRARAAAA